MELADRFDRRAYFARTAQHAGQDKNGRIDTCDVASLNHPKHRILQRLTISHWSILPKPASLSVGDLVEVDTAPGMSFGKYLGVVRGIPEEGKYRVIASHECRNYYKAGAQDYVKTRRRIITMDECQHQEIRRVDAPPSILDSPEAWVRKEPTGTIPARLRNLGTRALIPAEEILGVARKPKVGDTVLIDNRRWYSAQRSGNGLGYITEIIGNRIKVLQTHAEIIATDGKGRDFIGQEFIRTLRYVRTNDQQIVCDKHNLTPVMLAPTKV
jgi:hypothetical protein